MKKKLILLILVVALLITAFAAPVSAAWSTNYTVTGNGPNDVTAIALAQQGKSGGDLGYDYAWCAAFVCDCMNRAGQSAAYGVRDAYVPTLADRMVESYGAIKVSSPQKGDLVVYTRPSDGGRMHIGIVYQVSGSTVYTVEGNLSNTVTKTTVAANASDNGWGYYYIRPNYKAANPPAVKTVTVSKDVNDVTVKWGAVANASYYDVYLIQSPWAWKDIKYSAKVSSGTSYTFKGVKDGTYKAFVISRPNKDSVQSPWVEVVVNSKITNTSFRSDKSQYQAGDWVTLSVTGSNVTNYSVWIYREGTIYTKGVVVSNRKWSTVFYDLEPGNYTAKAELRNSANKVTLPEVTFTVLPKRTTEENNSTISVSNLALPPIYMNKGTAYANKGTVTSTGELEYVMVEVVNDAGHLATGASVFPKTKTYDLANFNSKLDFKSLSPGDYTYYVRVKNSSGIKRLACHRFTIVNSTAAKLGKPVVTLDKDTMAVGDMVTVTWPKVTDATSYIACLIQSPWGMNEIRQNAVTKNNSYRFVVDKPGDYQIFVVARDEKNHYISAQSTWQPLSVRNNVPVTGITLDETELTMEEGNAELVVASVLPADATDKTVVWSSSDGSVATVANGRINALKAGETDIIATTQDGGFSATCKVTVVAKTPPAVPVSGVVLNKGEMALTEGEAETLTATVAPSDASNKEVIWDSADAAVATVENGVVTAKGAGQTIITVTTKDGSKTDICKVTVKAAAVEPTPDPDPDPKPDPKPDPDPAPFRFDDVKDGKAFYFEAVYWAVDHKPQITNGMTPTLFKPGDTCTRAQVVTFLWRAKGQPEPKSANNPFFDVKSGDYFYKAVLWAVENGVTEGMTKTTFGPKQGCTRGQVVTFLHRAEGKPAAAGKNVFSDVKAGAYYYDAVLWAVSKDITKGTDATHFSPNATCTRGQIVTFLYRDLGK